MCSRKRNTRLTALVPQTGQLVGSEGGAYRHGEPSAVSVPAATRIRQQRKAGRSMSKRSGQSGSVRLVGCKWYGRYWRDVPGIEKRAHAHVILGETSSMTKPQARHRLMVIIVDESVTKHRHLEGAL